MKLTCSNPVTSHPAIHDGNRLISKETAIPSGAVFVIKCDFHCQDPITGKIINQPISSCLCSVCSVFFSFVPYFFLCLTEEYANSELGRLAIKSF